MVSSVVVEVLARVEVIVGVWVVIVGVVGVAVTIWQRGCRGEAQLTSFHAHFPF